MAHDSPQNGILMQTRIEPATLRLQKLCTDHYVLYMTGVSYTAKRRLRGVSYTMESPFGGRRYTGEVIAKQMKAATFLKEQFFKKPSEIQTLIT